VDEDRDGYDEDSDNLYDQDDDFDYEDYMMHECYKDDDDISGASKRRRDKRRRREMRIEDRRK